MIITFVNDFFININNINIKSSFAIDTIVLNAQL